MILNNQLFDLLSSIKHLCADAKSLNHRSLLIIDGDQREQIFKELFSQNPELIIDIEIEEVITLGATQDLHPFHHVWTDIPHINLGWSHSKVRLGGSSSLDRLDSPH